MKASSTYYVILCHLLLLAACQAPKKMTNTENSRFFVGTSTDLSTEGIYVYSMNDQTGDCTAEYKASGILNPSFLTVSEDQKFLYAIHRVEEQKESGVSAYSINEKTGALSHLNQQSTAGIGACYISIEAGNENIMIANYVSGSISLLPILKDGRLGAARDVVQHKGSSSNPERQEGPHAHYIHSGIGNMVYAADLGIDKIMLYKVKNGKFTKGTTTSLDLHAGAGPRHIDFHPNERFLYIMNELEGSVTFFEYEKKDQSFKKRQSISSLPANFNAFNKSADIHIHPSGKYLYASNRGEENSSIAVYRINQKTGLLSLVEIESEAINWPRNFAISPNGKFLLCANLNDDSISVFSIDEQSGTLRFTGKKIPVPKPLCIQFAVKHK